MNTLTVYLTANFDLITDSGTIILYTPEYTIKGLTSVYFNLTGVSESRFKVGRLNFSWGDTLSTIIDVSENYFLTFTNLTAKSIVDSTNVYNHIFTPLNNLTAYYFNLSSIITVYYDQSASDQPIQIVVPFRIAKSSYYDDVDGMSVLNTQVIPTAESNSLINFTANKNAYTFVGVLSN